MKLATNLNTIDSNMEMQSREFRIGNMGIIMDVLSKLYSNPIQTLTQEYISNGRDSMREAGNTKDKMHITLPTPLNPIMKIRDYGVGLSENRIDDVFLAYGMSTKGNSNEQTGGFGIGGKSFLSYTDSITITSWYNGVKTIYIVYKSGGNLKLDTVSSVKSKEKTGVQIEIAVKPNDIKYFTDAVTHTVYFWDKGEMPIVRGYDIPEKIEGHKIGGVEFIDKSMLPGIFDTGNYRINGVAGLIIDGIYYHIDESITKKLKSFEKLNNMLTINRYLLFKLDNGVVQIAPSREEIVDNDKTIDALNRVVNNAFMQISNEINSKFKHCKEIKDHIKVCAELSKTFVVDRTVGDFTIERGGIFSKLIGSKNTSRSTIFRSTVIKPTDGLLINKFYGTSGRFYNKVITDKITKINQSYIKFDTINDNSLYFIDTKLSNVGVNNRVRTLLESGKDNIVLVPIDLKSVAKQLGAVNLSTVCETKVTRTSKRRGNESFQVKKYSNNRWHSGFLQTHITLDAIEQLGDFYWIDSSYDANVIEVCKWLAQKELRVYMLTKRAVAAFKDLGNAINVSDYIANYTKVDNSLNNHIFNSLDISQLNKFKGKINKIDDKFWTKMLKYSKIELIDPEIPALLRVENSDKAINEFDKLNTKWINHVKKNYPLLANVNHTANVGDLVEYINLKYNKGIK